MKVPLLHKVRIKGFDQLHENASNAGAVMVKRKSFKLVSEVCKGDHFLIKFKGSDGLKKEVVRLVQEVGEECVWLNKIKK